MSSSENAFLSEIFFFYVLQKKKIINNKSRRPKWCKEWLLQRKIHSHVNLMKDLRNDCDDWRNYMRMDETAYKELLALVTPFIQRQNTVMRESISPHERLSCTLRFLATGRSYRDLRFSAAISHQALSKIIPETCTAIFVALRAKYLQIPRSQNEWKEIAEQFEKKWNFPHCLGAVDGKHVRIVPPSDSGSYFYNYKGFHSMVLMAVVNANYEFIACEFGVNGRISDGGVIELTTFHKKLKQKNLCIPAAEQIKKSNRVLNYVFVGNEAFALTPNFLKPFNQKELTNDTRIYNYRLSRARRVVENAFGILASRFRIFDTSINMKLTNIESVVMACCALHNFLIKKYSTNYTSAGSLDYEDTIQCTLSLGLRTSDSDLAELRKGHYKAISNDGKLTRLQYLDYFTNEGTVPWQNKLLNIIE